MALFKTRKLKKETAKKQAYLKYYKQTKKQGRKPQTYGTWMRAGKTSPRYYRKISPTEKQRRGLSPSDAKAIEKFFKK